MRFVHRLGDMLRRYLDADIEFSGMRYLTYLAFVFIAACMLGWIYEVIDVLITFNTLTNRGFLYGPWLPIYGTGAVSLLVLLGRWRRNPFIVFFGAMLVAGVLEYATGAALMAIWHERWWDYTGLPLNIQGYVCLYSVLAFGTMALLLFYLIDPLVRRLFDRVKSRMLPIVVWGFAATMFVDFVLTMIFRHPI
ncbi:MAG: putative ABC transporter permease [Coriobacteriia bacterium]|nr:putative ABC transporter permease [Coriobacteriia bacterium]